MRKQVKASSLLEVVVAMVIAVTVFGIGMATYLNVTRSSFSLRHFNAQLWLQETAAATVEQKRYFDEQLTKENLTLYKKVQPHPQGAGILLLEMEVLDSENQLIASRKQLISTDEER